MSVICISADEVAVKTVTSVCGGMPGFETLTVFPDAGKALEYLDGQDGDIVLFDADLRCGFPAGEEIRRRSPDASILYLSGSAEHALDAFSVHASTYLLKPLSAEKLRLELEHALRMRPAAEKQKVRAKTFGNFELLADGRAVSFHRSRSKELLAYLVDRRGSGVSRSEAFSVLWEDGVYDRSMQKQLDVIIRSMRLTLKEYGISRILDMGRGSMRVLPEMLDCDLYHFQDGEEDYIRLYQGEYMSSYAWGRLTEAYMTEIKMSASGVKAGSGRML